MGDGGPGARARRSIHIDPRFTRTSAMATKFIGIRAGSDIAFLGGVIHYILEHERWFDEYVKHYTNAPVIVDEGFRDTEELDGLFSGWDPETGKYDVTTWQYAGMQAHGARASARGSAAEGRAVGPRRRTAASSRHGEPPEEDADAAASALRLPDPEAPLRALHAGVRRRDVRLHRRGVPRGTPRRSATNSGRERTGAFAYAVGWTQHTVGVQYIRTAAIIQLLLGNIGPARAAASWRCAATRRSRARPTSRRSTTSCPAT